MSQAQKLHMNTSNHHRHQGPARQTGASLIEVLVAALLLSVGLLALAGLQATSLRMTKEAQFRSAAAGLASAYSEAVKANTAGALAGAYNYAVAYVPAAAAIPQPLTCRDGVTDCTAAQIAADDLAAWRESARMALPGGSLFATLVPAALGTPASINLWVLWQGPSTDDTADTATAQISTNCPPTVGNMNRTLQCMPFKIPL
jgi:type IV pilus assembly protein PilV